MQRSYSRDITIAEQPIFMQREASRGVVLKSTDYKEGQRIIALFTESHGLIHLFVKGLLKKNSSQLALLTTPFSLGEFHYTISHSQLYALRDSSLIDAHLHLRQRLMDLTAAGELCNSLLASQLPGKAAPQLYKLLLVYLRQIPTFENPSVLIASFLLKLLKHEGILSDNRTCMHCHKPAIYLMLGEPACALHASESAHYLSSEEWHIFLQLLGARDFAALKEITLTSSLNEKIKLCFQERFSKRVF